MSETDARADLDLLADFARTRGEAAFAELARRHAPLVYNLCRRVLEDRQEAEDAAQAVFLTLARKAGALRPDTVLPAWLHRVAVDVARNMRAARTARREREREVGAMSTAGQTADPAGSWEDIRAELDEALDDLPERHRRAVILFHLQGLSLEETARALDRKVGTVGYWLACGRDGLRRRLARRGVAVSSGALVALVSANARAVEVPVAFVQTIAQSAPLAAPVAAASAAVIMKGALTTMASAKLKAAAVGIAAAGLLGIVGFGVTKRLGAAKAASRNEIEPPAVAAITSSRPPPIGPRKPDATKSVPPEGVKPAVAAPTDRPVSALEDTIAETSKPAPPSPPDMKYADPKLTYVTFLQALKVRNLDDAMKATTGDPQRARVFQGWLKCFILTAEFCQTCEQRFGKDSTIEANFKAFTAEELDETIKQVTLHVSPETTGDAGRLKIDASIINRVGELSEFTYRNVDGAWKMDLDAIPDYDKIKVPWQYADHYASAFQAVVDELRLGFYASAKEASDALTKRTDAIRKIIEGTPSPEALPGRPAGAAGAPAPPEGH